jgi:hypothetical protein
MDPEGAVATATHSEAGTPESKADGALIAEIAPPMLDKLKNDGKLYGLLCVATVIFAVREFEVWGSVKAGIASVLRLGPDSLDRVSDIGLLVGFLAVFLVGPSYFQWRAIRDELKYRRQHGKWRWER